MKFKIQNKYVYDSRDLERVEVINEMKDSNDINWLMCKDDRGEYRLIKVSFEGGYYIENENTKSLIEERNKLINKIHEIDVKLWGELVE